MRIQIIQDDVDTLCLYISRKFADSPDLTGEVFLGSMPSFGLHRHEYIGRAIPDVFVVPLGDRAPDHGFRILPQFLALLIEADDGLLRIIGLGIQIKHLLHSLNELGSERWYHPHF